MVSSCYTHGIIRSGPSIQISTDLEISLFLQLVIIAIGKSIFDEAFLGFDFSWNGNENLCIAGRGHSARRGCERFALQ